MYIFFFTLVSLCGEIVIVVVKYQARTGADQLIDKLFLYFDALYGL